jgi:hypothetical protein
LSSARLEDRRLASSFAVPTAPTNRRKQCPAGVVSWERNGLAPRIVLTSVAGVDYRYELRDGDELVATGHLSREQPLEVGDRIEIGGQQAIVRTIEPLLGEPELHLVLRLLQERN